MVNADAFFSSDIYKRLIKLLQGRWHTCIHATPFSSGIGSAVAAEAHA